MFGLLGAACLGYLGLCALVYARQPSLVFFPSREVRLTPADVGLAYEEWWIRTEDGLTLHAWAIQNPACDSWVLHCHGNGGNIAGRISHLQLFRSLGLNAVIFDYRGYGKSEGTPRDEEGLLRDAEAVWRKLTLEREIPPAKIVLMGESLGGGVAAALAERHRPAGLILHSTFTSLPDRGAEIYPFLPVRLLSRIRLDTLGRVRGLDCPKLFVHGREDEVIPFHHGLRLYEAAAEPKRWLEVPGGHNSSPLQLGEEFRLALGQFVIDACRP